jgi:hypothetical protein
MTGWRLVVAAGLVAGSVLVARTVSAGADFGTSDRYTTGDEYATSESAGSDDTWTRIGWGALTGLSNLVYVPAKLAYAGLGGLTGGLALGLTGGDLNTAEAIWEPSLRGDYFLTTGMIQGQDPISFAGAAPGLPGGETPDDAPATVPPLDPHRDS